VHKFLETVKGQQHLLKNKSFFWLHRPFIAGVFRSSLTDDDKCFKKLQSDNINNKTDMLLNIFDQT
jgi:hypothetical protein